MIAGACITNPDFFKPVEFGRPNFVRVSLAFESVANQAASCPDFWATGVDVPPEGGVGRRVLKDISPGKYRVCYTTLQDRCGLYDDSIRPPLSEALDVHSKSAEPLRFRLPAASVRVEYEHPTEDVKDYGEALLMAVREGGKVVRRESARYEATSWLGDPSLSPYLDFVPPGCYTLVGWREDFGWARSGPINVEEGKITDGGVLKFHPGGTLQGRIALPDVCAVPDRVVAVDETGLTIPVKSEWTRGGYKFAVRDLWPGKWTLKVLDRDHNVIVEKQAELKATETVEIE